MRLVGAQKIFLVKLCQRLRKELRWISGVEDLASHLLQIGNFGVQLLRWPHLKMSGGHRVEPLEIAIANQRVAGQEKLGRS